MVKKQATKASREECRYPFRHSRIPRDESRLPSRLVKSTPKRRDSPNRKLAALCKQSVPANVPRPIVIKDEPSDTRVTRHSKARKTPQADKTYREFGEEHSRRSIRKRSGGVYGPPELSLGPPTDAFGWWRNPKRRHSSNIIETSSRESCQKAGESSSASKEQNSPTKRHAKYVQSSTSLSNENVAGKSNPNKRDHCPPSHGKTNEKERQLPKSSEGPVNGTENPQSQSKDNSKSKVNVKKDKGTQSKETYTRSELNDMLFLVDTMFAMSKNMGKNKKSSKKDDCRGSTHSRRSKSKSGEGHKSSSARSKKGKAAASGQDSVKSTCDMGKDLEASFRALRQFASKCESKGGCSNDQSSDQSSSGGDDTNSDGGKDIRDDRSKSSSSQSSSISNRESSKGGQDTESPPDPEPHSRSGLTPASQKTKNKKSTQGGTSKRRSRGCR